MTLKFSRVRGAAKIHVPAKFHLATCSGSWVVLPTENKKLWRKQCSPSLPRGQ